MVVGWSEQMNLILKRPVVSETSKLLLGALTALAGSLSPRDLELIS
jgi:hypothetical protein